MTNLKWKTIAITNLIILHITHLKKGILVLKVNYFDNDDQTTTLDIPISLLKKDAPLKLAKYICKKVVESRSRGRYNVWTKKIILNHSQTVCCLYRNHNINISSNAIRRANNKRKLLIKKSKNTRNTMKILREKCVLEYY